MCTHSAHPVCFLIWQTLGVNVFWRMFEAMWKENSVKLLNALINVQHRCTRNLKVRLPGECWHDVEKVIVRKCWVLYIQMLKSARCGGVQYRDLRGSPKSYYYRFWVFPTTFWLLITFSSPELKVHWWAYRIWGPLSSVGIGERKCVQTVLVIWPRWPLCPYMVKTLKNLLLWNQKADGLETW